MKRSVMYFFLILLLSMGCNKSEEAKNEEITKMEHEFTIFADKFESKAAKIYKNYSEAYYIASIDNTPENWEKCEKLNITLNELYSDKKVFKKIVEFKESKMIKDALLNRRLTVLYNTLLGNHVNTEKLNEITKKATEIEQKYSAYRADALGRKLSDNEVEDILASNKNSGELQSVWEAHKKIGPIVEKDIKALVKMRNAVAKELGFKNYHTMSLTLSEQNPYELEVLFDELDVLTKDTYIKVKKEIDSVLAIQNKISSDGLMPWHYQNRYFQEAPKIFDIDLDKYYADKDVVKLTKEYFAGIGMNIDNILKKSDLYEKPGKNQHAYCINIDRDKNDVRVLCNVVNNTSWMETMLHEYGHAVYEVNYNKELPWILKEPAHIFTTEAVAMFFGRLSVNPSWIQLMTGISDKEKEEIRVTCEKQEQHRQLVFSRWVQVVYRFEKAMYANPDQDLNKLWWDLVEKYQMIKRPSNRNMPDWATKIHIATAPCYYHNYLLGELLASQYQHKLLEVLQSNNPKDETFAKNELVGKFFRENIFASGKLFLWNDMIEFATGSKLDPKYFAKQYVK